MSGSTPCSVCCPSCTSTSPSSAAFDGAYSLRYFFAAGTLDFSTASRATICNHTHAEDSWHPFNSERLLPVVNDADDSALRQLEFLCKHRFLAATYAISSAGDRIYIRVYLIPYDLSGVQGALRRREDRIVSDARKCLQPILSRVTQSPEAWRAELDDGDPAERKFLLQQKPDPRTLAELYGDLDSPNPGEKAADIPDVARDLLDGFSLPGLRSKLYDYQRHSVAEMVCKETGSLVTPNPLYVTLHSISGEVFYLQPATLEILREPPVVMQSRGGILCEELGTGKTVMVLSLILATLDELPAPEESALDTRPVLTPLALHAFPGAPYQESRRRARLELPVDTEHRVPSLVECLLHHTATVPDRTHAAALEKTGLVDLLAANRPFYYHFNVEALEQSQTSRRKSAVSAPRVMWLSSATLVVVPPNLVAQWQRETQKHCDDRLRVLTVNKAEDMPEPRRLASDYDIILMSVPTFSAESRKTNTPSLHKWPSCRCPPLLRARIPDCTCPSNSTDPGVSNLLRVRWKRLVLDEGHNAATTSTNLTPFALKVSAERRWIVSGTPTTNLLGLSFGSGGSSSTESSSEACAEGEGELVPDIDMEGSEAEEPESGGESSSDVVNRNWTADDRKDLGKLKTFLEEFLCVPQFASAHSLFGTHVSAPLFGLPGPRPGAIRVLQQVMQSVMIRHRIADVERDVVLPAMRHETVLLDLGPCAVKSYNALQALIAINAVDSQRSDQDYLFHNNTNSRKALGRAIENISQTMFWRTDEKFLEEVNKSLKAAEKIVERAVAANVSETDMALLKDAFVHLREAGDAMLWRATQMHTDPPHEVWHLDAPIFAAWTRSLHFRDPSPSSPDAPPSAPPAYVFLHPDRLLRMRRFLLKKPLASQTHIEARGARASHEDALVDEYYLEMQRGQKRKRGEDEDERQVKKVRESAQRSGSKEVLERITKELDAARGEDGDGKDVMDLGGGVSDAVAGFLGASPLAGVRIGPSMSTKQTWILDQVLRYGPGEKFLIFSKSPLTLAHVSEGLDLLNVKYLQSSRVKVKQREQLVLTFETSDIYRVFLMELQHGARGLNMVTASRVIFCEPVWEADVESQAIKRVHRIGQKRSVNVSTLAIRGTSEEYMVGRRNALREQSGTGKSPGFMEERGIRDFIANPTFLKPCDPATAPTLDIPLIPQARLQSATAEDAHLVELDDSRPAERVRENGAPRKATKGVRIRIPSEEREDRMVPEDMPAKSPANPGLSLKIRIPGGRSPAFLNAASRASPKKRPRKVGFVGV